MKAVSLAVLAVLAGLALAPPADAHLTAIRARIGDDAAFVRVVVDFAGGRIAFNEVEATDPFPFGDGTTRLRIRRARSATVAARVRAHGVRARVVRRPGRLVILLGAAERRFKYVEYFILRRPERLVIDLWKSRPPVRGAQFRVARQLGGGCLTLRSYSVARGTVRAAGRERNLFEHSFAVRIRNARGSVVAARPISAVSGRWSVRLRYRVARRQAGTLEAVELSAKDAALGCLVQVRVRLVPTS